MLLECENPFPKKDKHIVFFQQASTKALMIFVIYLCKQTR